MNVADAPEVELNMNYFGTDLAHHGHYLWKLEGDSIGKGGKMKTRIIRYLNDDRYLSEWMIEIKTGNKRYTPLFNGDKPHYFKGKDEAEKYLKSIRDSLKEKC